VDWEPDHISWYIDGQLYGTTTNTSLIPAEAMYPIINLAVGGAWGGNPDASTQFPATMDVDYIRVFQKA
jgi:beta-glucanase (GH16 family)